MCALLHTIIIGIVLFFVFFPLFMYVCMYVVCLYFLSWESLKLFLSLETRNLYSL